MIIGGGQGSIATTNPYGPGYLNLKSENPAYFDEFDCQCPEGLINAYDVNIGRCGCFDPAHGPRPSQFLFPWISKRIEEQQKTLKPSETPVKTTIDQQDQKPKQFGEGTSKDDYLILIAAAIVGILLVAFYK